MNRRQFIFTSAAAAVSSLSAVHTVVGNKRPPHILLRSSWQVVNIGDIAHTPGVLALLQKYIPEAEVRLWASTDLSEEVAAMEHKRFPKLKIVKGSIGAGGKASNKDLGEAIEWCDFLLHGSGPSMVAHKDVAAFVKQTGKPFGVYGITYGGFGTAEKELMSQAKFLYFRDSVSLEKARADGIKCPVMEFGPDGAFAADLRNDEAATAFLKVNGLEEKKFLCCIPRLRFTPYWKIRGKPMTAVDDRKHVRNEAMKEHDNAPLREAITAVVRETDFKVLVCPEDKSQMEVGREMIMNKLPDDVRKRVVWREHFWLTDEALSTYVRSVGLFGLEMHSPIMCIGNGIPAIVCRFAEQTSKGFMWRDIGLGDWLFDMDVESDVANITKTVLAMAKDPATALTRVSKAMEFVKQRQRETMAVLAKNL
ncbi:MAG: polysaccharide pyruvyl transferase family protein [Kiritimatiellae bacterium]|nr:polysaccharide pyruvyl transferase family protein [Kiritimatiellia bacterium]MDD5521586.1 polysaccharide pyruvyl transferase family protein [Kiritimatiellia bacterium]